MCDVDQIMDQILVNSFLTTPVTKNFMIVNGFTYRLEFDKKSHI